MEKFHKGSMFHTGMKGRDDDIDDKQTTLNIVCSKTCHYNSKLTKTRDNKHFYSRIQTHLQARLLNYEQLPSFLTKHVLYHDKLRVRWDNSVMPIYTQTHHIVAGLGFR
jgi:hypothetical protein